MKRITIKDKILLHIFEYRGFAQGYEPSAALTQDGIAEGVGISRSHVAITMTNLKEKGMVAEYLASIRGLARQRKTYVLTTEGMNYTGNLRNNLYTKTVMFKDTEGNTTEILFSELSSYLFPFINRFVNFNEIIKHLSKDNIFDTKSFIEKERKGSEPKKDPKKPEQLDIKQLIPKPPGQQPPTKTQTVPTTTAPPSQSPAPSPVHYGSPAAPPMHPSGAPTAPPPTPAATTNPYPTSHGQPQTQFVQPLPGQPPPPYTQQYPAYYQAQHPSQFYNPYPQQSSYQYPSYYPFPYNYYQYGYSYPYGGIPYSPEKRKKDILGTLYTFFGIGASACIFGILLMLLTGGYCFLGLLIPVIFGFIFGIVGFSTGFKKIAFIGKTGRRLLLAMGIFYITMVIITLESFLFNFFLYLEFSQVGPILLGMVAFIALITIGNSIKTQYKIELAFIVGILCILFGIFSSLLLPEDYVPNPYILSPFWILFGVISIVIGNELAGALEMEPKEKFSNITKYGVVAAGLFLFIVVVTRLYVSNYNSNILALSYISDLCWLGIGAYLISTRFVNEETATNMLDTVKISLPIGIGLLFILFGLFLFFLDKFIEAVIEIVIGAVVIRYGFSKNIISKNKSEMVVKLSFPIFLVVSMSITFYIMLLV